MQIVNSRLEINRRYWYVMGAYRFEEKAEEYLTAQGIDIFYPKEIIYIKKPHRRPIATEKPAIPTLIYVHASREELAKVKQYINSRIKYITTTVDGHLDFLVVPDQQMQAFIHIWQQRYTYHATLSNTLLQPGAPVRIISGPMAGLTGTLLRHLKSRPLSTPASTASTVAKTAATPAATTPVTSPAESATSTAATPSGNPDESASSIEAPDTPQSSQSYATVPSASAATTPVPHSRISLRLANLLAITLDLPTASLEPIE